MNFQKTPENTFKSQVAGYFYPSNKILLKNQLNNFFKNVDVNYSNQKIKGIIAPHAGYSFSGKTAMYAYKQLYFSLLLDTEREYKIIVLSPSHKSYFEDIAVLSKNHYQIPTNYVKIYNSENLKKYENDDAFIKEHSFEVQLPFIDFIFKKLDKEYSVLPILIGDGSAERVYDIIRDEITDNTIIIASSDLSHFLDNLSAKERDEKSIKNILENKEDIDACGKVGIEVLNIFSKEKNLKKELLNYTDSSEATKDFDSVVGYASFIYYKEDKNILLKIARKSIYNKLNNLKDNFNDLKEIIPEKYLEKQGVFVTLTIDDNLRGCIGDIYSRETIFESVINNSKSAAFNDPRFDALTKNEFKEVKIEVSILSKPEKCTLEEISKGDGVILSRGFNKSVYLPQVWDQINSKEEFLGSLCEKAGLDYNCFLDEKTNFEKFNVKSVEE